MEFKSFIEWSFLGIIGLSAPAIVALMWKMNDKLAVIIEKVAWHEKWLERHDEDIKNLKD